MEPLLHPVDPPATRSRLDGVDLARAVAFFGMVLVNFRLALAPDDDRGSWLLWFNMLFDGRASATFVVLAGVGISLLTQRARTTREPGEIRRVRRLLLKRAVFLFCVGLLYIPIWPADILHYYGAYLAVAALLVCVVDAWLLGFAACLVLGFAAALLFGPDYGANWDWKTLDYRGFWSPQGFALNLFYNGYHPVVPWLAFVLFGMWLGRRDLHRRSVQRTTLAVGIGLLVAVELASYVLTKLAAGDLGADDAHAVFGTAPMPPMPLYMLAGIGAAMSVIGASLRIADRRAGAWWLRPLLDVGQLSLTLYVAHVVLGILPVLVVGGDETKRTVVASTSCAVAFSSAALPAAWLWKRRFTRGPLELLLRRLTGEAP